MDRSRLRKRRPTCRAGGRLECLEARTLLSGVDLPAALVAALPAGDTNRPANATDFDALIGASAARSTYKVDGTGSTVAVIDTGVNYNHPDLGGGFGAGRKVVAGFDFSNGSGDPNAFTWQHGTAVAGLIAGSDPKSGGVAPGADIVALRVFGNDNRGDFNRVADALQWVVDNRGKYGITVVNLSISDGNSYTRNWYANDKNVGQRITELIHTLKSMNVPVVTATGNSFNGFQGVGFTGIVAESISVTATDAADKIVATAQRLGPSEGLEFATDLAAPGQALYAPVEGDKFNTVDGTSFAAPLVTGSIVLLQQVYRQRFGQLPSVDEIERWLKQGADTITDATTGIKIGRLDIPGSAALIPAPQVVDPPPSDPPPVTNPPDPVPAPVPAVQVFFNGTPVTGSAATTLTSGWSNFFSLFTGSLKTLRGWGKSGAISSGSATTINLTKIQGWSNKSAKAGPSPAGLIAPSSVVDNRRFVGKRRPH